MMKALLERGEALARSAQRASVQRVARELRAKFGAAAVQVNETRVAVSGRGLVRRWLVDPGLRFLRGGLS